MSLDLAPAIRTALLAEPTIAGLLSEFQGEASIFTRRPVPKDAAVPFISITEDISVTDADGLNSDRPVVIRDIIVYGNQKDDYRTVEQIAYSIRELFHRKKDSLISTDYFIIDIRANGPRSAPTSDDEIIGRVVSITIQLRNKS